MSRFFRESSQVIAATSFAAYFGSNFFYQILKGRFEIDEIKFKSPKGGYIGISQEESKKLNEVILVL
jgi:hypothetical protein